MSSFSQFGRYQIFDRIGQGGMSTVYHAQDTLFQREVALKVLPPHLVDDPAFRERFDREAKIIARLEHQAIVPVYDYGEHEGQPFIVMRLMTGGSLAERLRQGRLSLLEVNGILQRICGALDKAHAAQIIHRDLKPGNILFDGDGAAYLADFGIARMMEGSGTVTVMGTPQYMAPEQAENQPVDARTDVYQAGVMLFQMLTGKVPFHAPTPAGLIYQHIHSPVPSVRTVDRTLPAFCDVIIQKAMAKDPKDRFQTTGELATAFAQALYSKKEGSMPAWMWVVGAILLFIFVAGVCVSLIPLALNQFVPAEETLDLPSPPVLTLQPTAEITSTTPTAAMPAATLTLPISITPNGQPSLTTTFSLPANTGGGTGWLAYAADQNGNFNIFRRQIDGSAQQQLTNFNANAFRPVWSPDGSQIAFHVLQNEQWDIFVMNSDGSGIVNVSQNQRDDSFPSWSPDGQQLLFQSNREGDFEIYQMNRDGSSVLPLTNNELDEQGPAWSPDGTMVAFSRRISGVSSLVVAALGTMTERVVVETESSSFPVWSPDGLQLAFHSTMDGNSEIYRVNLDGTGLTRLTNTLQDEFYPFWSPDGGWIVYHADMDGNRELWVMPADGSAHYQLTQTPWQERQPSWQP